MNASLEDGKYPMMKSCSRLFEPELHVIVRGKAGAEMEFGNLLILDALSDPLFFLYVKKTTFFR
jgi:hypothetical protein